MDAKSILVPLDGSSFAERAIPLAAWYSGVTGLGVRFIHVLDAETRPTERSKAADLFQAYASRVGSMAGLSTAACDVLLGSSHEEVLSASVTAAAIVIATHGRSGFRATVIGSTADKVIRGSGVPVLVVPGGEATNRPGPGTPVVVGLDGSDEAELGLAVARELAAKGGLKVVLFRAFSFPPPVAMEFTAYPGDLAATVEAAARDYLTRTARPGEQTILSQGSAAFAVLEAAEQTNAGLIVLTSSGKGCASRIALGSTTDRVIHGTDRPVLVVPAPAP